MTSDERADMTTLLIDVLREMIVRDGYPLSLVDPDEPLPADGALAVSIGLGRPDLKGALMIMAQPSFFRLTYPLEVPGGVSEEAMIDWAGELANQLLGRFKNRLCTRGLDFNIAAPMVIGGNRLQVRLNEGPHSLACKVRLGSERVDLRLELIREDGQSLLTTGTYPSVAALEGDTILF